MPEQKVPNKMEELNDAPYNPRMITPEALSGLTDSLQVFGDLSGFVWNEQTGNIVCGHQRKKALAGVKLTEIQWAEPYEVELGPNHDRFKSKEADGFFVNDSGGRFKVRKVSWIAEFEKAANISANDPRIQGVFESTMLHSVIDDIHGAMPDLSEMMNFSGLDELLNAEPISDTETVQFEADKTLKKNGVLVEVECETEDQAEKLFNELKERKLKCRILTLE